MITFTNKFIIGDKVVCIKSNRYFPESNIQPNDEGVIIEVNESWRGGEITNVELI